MPYEVRACGKKYCVYKKGTNKSFGSHDSRSGANKQLRALYASETKALVISIDQAINKRLATDVHDL